MGHPFEKPADVYAFGIILWELLTWQIPWETCGPWQVSMLGCMTAILARWPRQHPTNLSRHTFGPELADHITPERMPRLHFIGLGRWLQPSLTFLKVAADEAGLRELDAGNACVWVMQVVIIVVEQKKRPVVPEEEDMPTPPPTCWTRYRDLMERCWASDPADRPTFEVVINDLRWVHCCRYSLLQIASSPTCSSSLLTGQDRALLSPAQRTPCMQCKVALKALDHTARVTELPPLSVPKCCHAYCCTLRHNCDRRASSTSPAHDTQGGLIDAGPLLGLTCAS